MQLRTGAHLDELRHNTSATAVTVELIPNLHQDPPRPEAAFQGDSNNNE